MGFWIFLGLVIIAATLEEAAQQISRARVLQAALEKGTDLDPKLLAQLFPGSDSSSETASKPRDPRSVRIAAIVVASIGLGFGVLALALKQIHLYPFWIFLGIGGLTLCVSAGIFIASRMIAARQQADSSATKFQA